MSLKPQDNSSSSPALSPRKKGAPPKLEIQVASAVDIQLAEVEGCVSGMRVNFASALETIMPVKHVAGSKFTGELSKAVFASEDGSTVIMSAFGDASQVLQRLSVGKVYQVTNARTAVNNFTAKVELVSDGQTRFAESSAEGRYRKGTFDDLMYTSCILSIDCEVAKVAGLPIYASCMVCKKKRMTDELECPIQSCAAQDWCYRFAASMTLREEQDPSEHRITLFEELAQSLIGVALNENEDNLIEDVEAAWMALPGTKFTLACRAKGSSSGGATSIIAIAISNVKRTQPDVQILYAPTTTFKMENSPAKPSKRSVSKRSK